MGGFEIEYRVSVQPDADVEAFIGFMTQTFLPNVHTGPTRVGQVTSLTLLRGVEATHAETSEFRIRVGYSGMATGGIRMSDAVEQQFAAAGAALERLGAYRAIWEWSE